MKQTESRCVKETKSKNESITFSVYTVLWWVHTIITHTIKFVHKFRVYMYILRLILNRSPEPATIGNYFNNSQTVYTYTTTCILCKHYHTQH